MCFGEGQQQLCAFGIEGFLLDQRFVFGKTCLEQRQFGEAAMAVAANARDQFHTLASLQAFGGRAAIGPGQATRTELDATKPADHHHCHLIEVLSFDGCQHRPSGGATRLAIVAETVLVADFPGPAVVSGGGIADRLDKRLGFFGARYGSRLGKKTALADDFQQFTGGGEGEGHGGAGTGDGERAAIVTARAR